jgi:formamidopyrimidine-DNA glycosylase
VLFAKDGTHSLLDNLGVEPLSELFDKEHLFTRSRKYFIHTLI